MPSYSVAQSCPDSLWTPWTAARQASLSFTISQSLLKLKFHELSLILTATYKLALAFYLYKD